MTRKNTNLAIYLCLGSSIRPGEVFIPPELLMEDYMIQAQERGGRVLYLSNSRFGRQAKKASQIFIWSRSTDKMLAADIVDGGANYEPDEWNKGSAYQPIEPFGKVPHRTWVEIKNLRWVDDFDTTKWTVVRTLKKEEISLEEHLQHSVRGEGKQNADGTRTEYTTSFRFPVIIIKPTNNITVEE